MNVVVQHIETRLYLASSGRWVKLAQKPVVFQHPVAAISHCIQRGIRSVRLVNDPDDPEKAKYVYPFGEDPTIKAERKQLRRNLAEARRLKQQHRILLARIDMLAAETKERKKQLPFKRKRIGED